MSQEVLLSNRLNTPFYENLRQKYPNAFRHRNSVGSISSDVTRKLLNSTTVPSEATRRLAHKRLSLTDSRSVLDGPSKLLMDFSPASDRRITVTNLDRNIRQGNLRGLRKTGSQYSSNSSVHSESAVTGNSRSLRERLHQNEDEWAKLLQEGPLSLRKHRGSLTGVQSSDSGPVLCRSISSDFSSKKLSLSSPVSHKPPLVASSRLNSKRFASPDSSNDSAVDVDSPSNQSSPPLHNQTLSLAGDGVQNRVSRQRDRVNSAAKERKHRSRTPKLKSTRAKQSHETELTSPQITKQTSVDSDCDSGIVGGNWTNHSQVTSHMAEHKTARSSNGTSLSNHIYQSVINTTDEQRNTPHNECSQGSSSEDVVDSRPKSNKLSTFTLPSHCIVSESGERYEEREVIERNATTKVLETSKKPPISPQEVLVSSKKPPVPQSKGSTKSKLSKGTVDDKSLSSKVENLSSKPKQKEKKSFLPWRKNKGRYTPSEEMKKVEQKYEKEQKRTDSYKKRRSMSLQADVVSVSTDRRLSSGYEDVGEDFEDEALEPEYETVIFKQDSDKQDTDKVETKPPRPTSSIASPSTTSESQTYAKVDLSKKPSQKLKQKYDVNSHENDDDSCNDSDDEPPLPPKDLTRDLGQSSSLRGSRNSLSGVSGGGRLFTLTKLRRAVSLENIAPESDNTGKLKKTPSLRSLTDLFKGKKNKEGKKEKVKKAKEEKERKEDTDVEKEVHMRKPPKAPTGSVRSRRKQRVSVAESVEDPRHFRSIGKLKCINSDGTQVMKLYRGGSADTSFYLTRGTNGIFISKLNDVLPEHFLAGLLNVGDQILEVNGRKVSELSIEAVYELLSHGDDLLVKTLPVTARKEDQATESPTDQD